jgi:hypothetical protein
MVDKIAAQLKQYWIVITTVVMATSAILGMNTISLVNQATMSSEIKANSKAIADFVAQGPRYSLKDHNEFARQQRFIDERQNERITIVEQNVERTP